MTRPRLPGEDGDVQARCIEAAVQGVLVAWLYLPNGNPQPGPRFAAKLRWFGRLIAHAAVLRGSGAPVVLAGDHNVVPAAPGIHPTRSWNPDALLLPASRDAFRRLLAQGWTDTVRRSHPVGPVYSFWDCKRDRWPRDAGLRLDQLLLSPDLAVRLEDAGVDRAVRGEPRTGDHVPVRIALRPPQRNAGRPRAVGRA